ncbi:MAG: hypothetical protein H6985_03465 [Pseudomonadales bacterium]|nr:hypothetical protein [Halioglobus sp.]MCP5128624.1 hypothetical protein [Pseudomonadales bacterium]
MSDHDSDESGQVPMMQKLLDNPFLLLFIGVASPAMFYLVWGLAEIFTVPAR